MAKKAKAGAAKPRASRSSKPVDTVFEEMSDMVIKPIEDAANRYVAIRDERMQLTEEEVALKTKLLKVMHQHGKTVYVRGDLSVRIVPEGESIKVTLKRSGKKDDEK